MTNYSEKSNEIRARNALLAKQNAERAKSKIKIYYPAEYDLPKSNPNKEKILFNARRGMSVKRLIEIYGIDAVKDSLYVFDVKANIK